MQTQHVVMGLWKFKDPITVETLGEVAEKWAAEDPNYLQLYIRRTSKDQRGIGFTYQLSPDVVGHDNYFDRTSDALKRQFGNGLVGWDLASDVWVIK